MQMLFFTTQHYGHSQVDILEPELEKFPLYSKYVKLIISSLTQELKFIVSCTMIYL